MFARITLVLLAGLTVGGCISQQGPVEFVDPLMAWTVGYSAEEGADLSPAVQEADDIRLSMACRPHAGAVDITFVGRRGDPAVIELRSGGARRRYPASGQDDEENIGGVDFDFNAPTTDPVLTRFANTGELSIIIGKRRILLPNAFASAHDFLAICRPL